MLSNRCWAATATETKHPLREWPAMVTLKQVDIHLAIIIIALRPQAEQLLLVLHNLGCPPTARVSREQAAPCRAGKLRFILLYHDRKPGQSRSTVLLQDRKNVGAEGRARS